MQGDREFKNFRQIKIVLTQDSESPLFWIRPIRELAESDVNFVNFRVGSPRGFTSSSL